MQSLVKMALLFVSAVTAQSNNCMENATGRQITNSNRNKDNLCPVPAEEGSECSYTCRDGFLPIGRHVCQSYQTEDTVVADHSFYGGRCQRLCTDSLQPCADGQVPINLQTSDKQGVCITTSNCMKPDDALKHLAKSNYMIWYWMVMNSDTELYLSDIDINQWGQDNSKGSFAATGIGLQMNCIAHSMGWLSTDDFQGTTYHTVLRLTGYYPYFNLTQSKNGWFPSTFDSKTGTCPEAGCEFNLPETGIGMSGILFAKKYMQRTMGADDITARVSAAADQIYNSIKFDSLLCDENNKFNENGEGIPFQSLFANDTICNKQWIPAQDGYYTFTEAFHTVWFAHEQSKARHGGRATNAIETMWQKWIGRKSHTEFTYKGHNILTLFSNYAVQLAYYNVHPFNSDADYMRLFNSTWEADKEYYTSFAYYSGDRGKYGLGAGPVEHWCAGSSYQIDVFTEAHNAQACRTYSPYITAGFLPAAPATIKQDLLDLLADSESVSKWTSLELLDYHILLRKSRIDPMWVQPTITTLDFSTELFGLATIWLGTDFFFKNSDYFGTGEAVFTQ